MLSPPAFSPEEVRRELSDRYGEKKLYEGGLLGSQHLDPKMQLMARRALVDGLVRMTRPMASVVPCAISTSARIGGIALADIPALGDVAPWRLAVVLDANGVRRPDRLATPS